MARATATVSGSRPSADNRPRMETVAEKVDLDSWVQSMVPCCANDADEAEPEGMSSIARTSTRTLSDDVIQVTDDRC